MLPARGRIREGRLFRVQVGDSCDPEESCVLALRTDAGWSATHRTCAGPIGGGRSIAASDTTLTWLESGKTDVLAIELTIKPSGTPSDAPTEIRWARLCGAGKSDKVSCTRPFITSCINGDKSRDVAKMEVGVDGVTLTSKSVAGEACGGEPGFAVGTFPLDFH